MKHQDLFFNLCDNSSYYETALEIIQGKGLRLEDVYVFSDDIDYAKLFLKCWPELNFVEYDDRNSVKDFILMSKCENAIVSNSTFSWWAAAISPKKSILRPPFFFAKDFSDDQSIWPKDWECIDINC